MPRTSFKLATRGPGLDRVHPRRGALGRRRPASREGLLTLFVRHTSCSLLIQENADPSARADLETFLARLVPRRRRPGRRLDHPPLGGTRRHARAHQGRAPAGLADIPVADGRLALGTWQGIYLWEHRARPHRREVAAHLG